jgi:creatinine amidohydrolase
LKDILEVLNRQGIKKLVIANSHGGNDFKSMIREAGLLFPDMFLCSCNWYQIGNKMDFFENPGDHADEAETSLLMYLRPDLVLPLSEAGDGVEKKNKISAFREGWAWTERKWSKVTKDTGVGNPKKATAEKGKKYFEMITREMASFFIDLAKTNRDDMYQ